MNECKRLLEIALDAARAASEISRQGWLQRDSIEVADKETILFKPSDQLIMDSRPDATPARRKPLSRTEDVLFKG